MPKIAWRLAGFRELRTSPEAKAEVEKRLKAIAAECGGEEAGYVVDLTDAPRNRARGAVIAATSAARRDNAANDTLLRSIDAGR